MGNAKNQTGFATAIKWILFAVVVFYGGQKAVTMRHTYRVASSIQEIHDLARAVREFYRKFGALPGDIADAGARINGCDDRCNPLPATADDGIVGEKDFLKTLHVAQPKTNVPAQDAADEGILFWKHLQLAGYDIDVDKSALVNGSDIAAGRTHPEMPLGGVLVAGYSDGTAMDKKFAPDSTPFPKKGLVVVWMSEAVLHGASPIASSMQALTPHEAVMIDRKMDDGQPGYGYIQAYGAADCFTEKDASKRGPGFNFRYNENNPEKSCGLVMAMQPQEKGQNPR